MIEHANPTSGDARRHRLLIVDDEIHILQVLSLKLTNAGYEVFTAADGEEGLELALLERPDLIITDFQMPYMTGLEMCCALSADTRTAGTPVLMLTARGYSLDDEDLATGNIRQVIHKPFSPRAVLSTVQELLAAPRERKPEADAA
jgi:two-component system alkaline phosphatase synthesis response regulator PhoP